MSAAMESIGRKAKDTASFVTDWCSENGISCEIFPTQTSGHPAFRITVDGRTAKVFFAGSPSDQRRSRHQALADVKRKAKTLGWTPPEKERTMVTLTQTGVNKFDSQRPSEGPAGPPVVTRYVPPPAGAPKPPGLDARNKWIFEQFEAGMKTEDVHRGLVNAGWHSLKTQSVYAQYRKMKQSIDLEWSQEGTALMAIGDMQKMGLSRSRNTEREAPKAQAAPPDTDPLVLAIAHAIAPLLKEQIRSLKEKADKWDAIAGLVKDA